MRSLKSLFAVLLLAGPAFGFSQMSTTSFSAGERLTAANLQAAVNLPSTYWNSTALAGGSKFTIAAGDTLDGAGTIDVDSLLVTEYLEIDGSATVGDSLVIEAGAWLLVRDSLHVDSLVVGAYTAITGDVALDGDLDFTGAQEISTTAGALTLNPTTNVLANAGLFIIGDGTTTSNANMTLGLIVDQRANDDGLIDGKSSDVAHGITSFAETNSFVTISKGDGNEGGLMLRGFSEGVAGAYIQSLYTTDNTTKTTSATGAIEFWSRKKSGTTVGAPGADANLAVFKANGTARFILDAEGSGHADVEWTTYDVENDFAAVNDIEAAFGVGGFVTRAYDRDGLADLGIFSREGWHTEGGRQRGMMDWTKMLMLHTGVLNKTAYHLMDNRARTEQVALSLESRFAALEYRNATLEAQIAALRRSTNFRIASLGN